jgi:hypothetical protein
VCPGCGQTFTPTHWRQRHCRASCRKRAFDDRAADQALESLASGVAAGAVEPDVVP